MRVPIRSAGSRSGVNWTREKIGPHALGHALGEQRLCDSGHPLDEEVAAGEQADQHPLHDALLPHHDPAELGRQAVGKGGTDLTALRGELTDFGGAWHRSRKLPELPGRSRNVTPGEEGRSLFLHGPPAWNADLRSARGPQGRKRVGLQVPMARRRATPTCGGDTPGLKRRPPVGTRPAGPQRRSATGPRGGLRSGNSAFRRSSCARAHPQGTRERHSPAWRGAVPTAAGANLHSDFSTSPPEVGKNGPEFRLGK